jgi:hypothetical protein
VAAAPPRHAAPAAGKPARGPFVAYVHPCTCSFAPRRRPAPASCP